ncbi:PilN domain-containing protein [Patescibacteria group bacterium]
MLQINLIPPKFQEKIRNKRVRSALVEASVFSIIIIIVAIIGIILLNSSLNLMKSNIEKQIKSQEEKTTKYSNLEKQISDYQENSELYDEALKNQYGWSKVIIHVSEITPANLQITQLNIKDSSDKTSIGTKEVDFTGKAASRREIAKFVKKLEGSEMFDKIELSSSSLDDEGQADFKITAVLIK